MFFISQTSEVQVVEKVREELTSVTRGERPLSLRDKPNTPYYNATILVTLHDFKLYKENNRKFNDMPLF